MRRADARDRWILAPLVVVSLGIAVVPALDDRRDLATLDGDATRYLGLVLMIVGSVLRVGPMFVLGRRFTWPLASQEPHPLITSGFYRFVRHPSYLGAFLGGIGWVLVFRSGLGLILMAMLLPAFLPVVRAEEALLMAGIWRRIRGLPPTDLAAGALPLLTQGRERPPSRKEGRPISFVWSHPAGLSPLDSKRGAREDFRPGASKPFRPRPPARPCLACRRVASTGRRSEAARSR